MTIESAQRAYEVNGTNQKRYSSFMYQAQSWEHPQRVIVKVEVTNKGTNVRCIATDMQQHRASHVYKTGFCAKSNMELRIKEHKLYLKSDRSSCNNFQANQFRLFLPIAIRDSTAYVLIHTLQKEVLSSTDYANATMKTIQLKILKTAAWVREMKTNIKIELPRAFANIEAQKQAFDILCPSGKIAGIAPVKFQVNHFEKQLLNGRGMPHKTYIRCILMFLI